MTEKAQERTGKEPDNALLKHELEKGLASGISKRTPAQIRAAFRKAREAA